ncbi:MAG: copper amine oxidase N-terminal domain-containing protein [Defluviitaleaceae bacterium]|nr:copper amine oxidase N-terminal domain-containing protein [Defluviitaleaceae bacterium]
MYNKAKNYFKLAVLLIIGVAVFTVHDKVVFASEAISVIANGERVNFPDQAPLAVSGRTLVPVRGVFEVLGFVVEWDSGTQRVTLTRSEDTILITLGSDTFTTNGESHTLDVPAQIIGGRTMLPIRAVLESVGYNLEWEEDTRTVVVGTSGVQSNYCCSGCVLESSETRSSRYDMIGHEEFVVFTSRSDIDNFFGSGTYNRYTEEFFADKFLIIAAFREPSGSNRIEFEDVRCNGDISITRTVVPIEYRTPDVGNWVLYITVDNRFIPSEFRMRVRQMSREDWENRPPPPRDTRPRETVTLQIELKTPSVTQLRNMQESGIPFDIEILGESFEDTVLAAALRFREQLAALTVPLGMIEPKIVQESYAASNIVRVTVSFGMIDAIKSLEEAGTVSVLPFVITDVVQNVSADTQN